MFEAFLDGQLLISAQTTAAKADALYGSAALDLPRRGVNYVQGGIGSLAEELAKWIRNHGGQILYRQQVDRIDVKRGRVTGLLTAKGLRLAADAILANLTPWSLVGLLGDATPNKLRQQIADQPATWGAFTLYLGLNTEKMPDQIASHHQVIVEANQPLGEGNSVFISLADSGDVSRAPDGKRPATLSTHTAISKWWDLYHRDHQAYLKRRSDYTERVISAAERAIPGIREAIDISLPGTPVTFETFTGRSLGMVGGFPQTSIWNARGPRTQITNLWLVGDSIFPGQSTAGVTLGALRTAADVIHTFSPRVISRRACTFPLAVGK
jgi:phytoene dehydrogenase-like protein